MWLAPRLAGIVDHGQHGAAKCLGTTDGLVPRDSPDRQCDELHRGVAVDFPVRDQQCTRLGVEEGTRQSRQRLGACLGGNGTLIGASANLTVAGLSERGGVPFRFMTYTYYAFPMMLVSIAICHVYVWWRYF